MKVLRTASLGSNFTDSYYKKRMWFEFLKYMEFMEYMKSESLQTNQE